jgi:hypothetical protein
MNGLEAAPRIYELLKIQDHVSTLVYALTGDYGLKFGSSDFKFDAIFNQVSVDVMRKIVDEIKERRKEII